MSKDNSYKIVELKTNPVDLTYPKEVAEAARQALEENPLNFDAKYRLAIALGQLENVEEALPLAKELYEHNQEQHLGTLTLLLGCANVHERYDLIEKMEHEFTGSPLYTKELKTIFEKALTPIKDNPFAPKDHPQLEKVFAEIKEAIEEQARNPDDAGHPEGCSRLDCCEGDNDSDLYPSP